MAINFPRKYFRNTHEDLMKVPNTSGLYYFYNKDDNLLYIGKAKNLKSRIRSHKSCNNRAREGAFLSKMMKLDLSTESKEKLTEALRYFKFRCMGTINPVAMDFVFHRTTKIEIEEMEHELTERREFEMIQKLRPLFNSETACDEYYEL
jgi:predicted GIY-YIG superfamily endonuclease